MNDEIDKNKPNKSIIKMIFSNEESNENVYTENHILDNYNEEIDMLRIQKWETLLMKTVIRDKEGL